MMRKDINKPKGKTSAYAFFVQTCREEHRKKNPEQSVNFAEFSKKCSERWKALSPSDKKCFEDMAKADKVRYNREMKDYVPPKGFGKRGRKRKDPNAPKRPPSAFFVFCSEYRPSVKQHETVDTFIWRHVCEVVLWLSAPCSVPQWTEWIKTSCKPGALHYSQ